MREAQPGDRLLVENGANVNGGTLGGVIEKDGKFWGVTAGHVFRGFSNHQRVWYFPVTRELLGTYEEPAIVDGDIDLAKFEVPEDLVLLAPLGLASVPDLLPASELDALKDQSVFFVGGQIGRVPGVVVDVGKHDVYERAIQVRLACSDLREGNSGGPLYLEKANSLQWLGTLAKGSQLGSGFSEGLFVHPGQGLSALGLT
jgi:hypothetical protein